MSTLDRTGPEDPVPGTEIARALPSTACSRRCGNHNHLARTPPNSLLWKELSMSHGLTSADENGIMRARSGEKSDGLFGTTSPLGV